MELRAIAVATLNESPSEKEGKFVEDHARVRRVKPSMKVPPKRKGNFGAASSAHQSSRPLNESPSEKEGKWDHGLGSSRPGRYPQ